MKRLIKTLLIVGLLLNIYVIFQPFHLVGTKAELEYPSDRPLIFIDPGENVNKTEGESVTISVKIFNLTNNKITDPRNPLREYFLGNLYGIDLKFSWDPSILNYTTHAVFVPKNATSSGVLNPPVYLIKDEVNATAGTYWLAISSQFPAEAFNNPGESNVIFNMTFTILRKGASPLMFTEVNLASITGDPIPHCRRDFRRGGILVKSGAAWDHAFAVPPRDGHVATYGTPWAHFVYTPEDYAVVNQLVIFDGSGSYDDDGVIVEWIWDFGDGNVTTVANPIITHAYATIGRKAVTLRVKDNEGIMSLRTEEVVEVVGKREISLAITKVPRLVLQNRTVNIQISGINRGNVSENVTLSMYYNLTSFEPLQFNNAAWQLIQSKQQILPIGSTAITFSWNTTDVPIGKYFIMVNATIVPYEDPTDNTALSAQAIEITDQQIHDVAITRVDVVASYAGRTFDLPVIAGEAASVTITVLANGTMTETFNLSVRIVASNGSEVAVELWAGQTLDPYGQETKTFSKSFGTVGWSGGTYTIEANATIAETDNYLENNFRISEFRLIQPPQLKIEGPAKASLGESVTFDAGESTFPDGTIVAYKWEVSDPDLNVRFSGNKSTITCTFDKAGDWLVVLIVIDNYTITYEPIRIMTANYQKVLTVNVVETGGLVDIYLIAAVVAIIVVVIAALIYIRFKRVKTKIE